MKIRKCILSILLTLAMALGLLALIPITASAIAPPNPPPFAVWNFTSANEDGGGSYNGGTWDWQNATKTLTLTNISHTSTGQLALQLPNGATIVLIGANTLTSTNASRAGYSTAISAGNLTIRGSGSLNATGGNTAYGSSSYGIECLSSLTISETVSVTAAGGTTALGSSRGIICIFSLTISDNASVTATGGTAASGESCGFAASGLTIGENASLVATGNTRAFFPDYTVPAGYTYYVNTATAPSATPLTGNGSTTVIGSTHKYARIASPNSPALTLSSSSWSPGVAAANTSVTVTANVAWTANSNATPWLTVSPASGTNNGSINITATANTGTAARTGTITVTGGSITRTVAVTQAGTETPTYTVTITNGTTDKSTTMAGDTVTITANTPPAGQRFKQWTISPAVTFTGGTSATSATAKFILPAGNVTATAVYENIPVNPPPRGIFGTQPQYNQWYHYILFFLCFGFIWMWF